MSTKATDRLFSLLLPCVFAAFVAVVATVEAAPRADTAKERASRCKGAEQVNLNFNEADLVDVIAIVSKATGRRFIIDSEAPATKITIFSPRPVCPGEAYEAFLSALAMNGLAVVRRGRYLVVMTTAKAVRSPIPVVIDRR